MPTVLRLVKAFIVQNFWHNPQNRASLFCPCLLSFSIFAGMKEKILIIDFGSQYTQLIARRVRESEVYCEIVPFNHIPELTPDIKGIILSGSPASVRDKDAPNVDVAKLIAFGPVLGVCYGAQLMAQTYGGLVEKSNVREYGRAHLQIKDRKTPFLRE